MAANRLCALMLLPVLAVSGGTAHGQSRQQRPLAANPSVFVAADIGFGRLAQDRGLAAAVKQYAEAEAQILSPQDAQSILAKDWAKQAQGAFRLQPQMVMMSCDGNIAVTKGQWTGADQRGSYVSVWTRDNKGRLKWRVHQRSVGQAVEGAPTTAQTDEEEFIRSRQAACSPKAARAAGAAFGQDGSLKWTVQPAAGGGSALHVQIWNGEEMETVVAPAMELTL